MKTYFYDNFEIDIKVCHKISFQKGASRGSNPGPHAPKAHIIPLALLYLHDEFLSNKVALKISIANFHNDQNLKKFEMFKVLIIYYSKTNSTKNVADIINKHIQADTIRVEPEKNYPQGFLTTCFVAAKEMLFRERPFIKNDIPDLRQYDTILIGSPIWASGLSIPMKTFLEKTDLSGKKISVFSTNRGGGANGAYKEVVKLFPKAQVSPIFLNLNMKQYDGSEEPIITWLHQNGLINYEQKAEENYQQKAEEKTEL